MPLCEAMLLNHEHHQAGERGHDWNSPICERVPCAGVEFVFLVLMLLNKEASTQTHGSPHTTE